MSLPLMSFSFSTNVIYPLPSGEHSPIHLSLITPSEQLIMRFLIWQTAYIIYSELIRHKTHGWVSQGISLFNTSTGLNLLKHSLFHLFLHFLFIYVLENDSNKWKTDNLFVTFKHSVYSVGSSNIISCLWAHIKFFWHLLLRTKNWNDNPSYFFPSIFFVPCRLSRKVWTLNITESSSITHDSYLYSICLETKIFLL